MHLSTSTEHQTLKHPEPEILYTLFHVANGVARLGWFLLNLFFLTHWDTFHNGFIFRNISGEIMNKVVAIIWQKKVETYTLQ